MRAIIAILPLAGLLSWLNPTPADPAGTWTAGFKHPNELAEAGNHGHNEAATLVSALESAVNGLTRESSTRPANHNTLPSTTMLVDSAVVR